MTGLHALHKMLAARCRPQRAAVEPGELVEIEPDLFSVIVGINASDAKKLVADLDDLGVKELPLKDSIVASSDHAAPAPTVQHATAHKLWRDFFRAHGIRYFDAGQGVSHLVMCEEGFALPGMVAIAIDSHGPTMGAVGLYATSLGSGRLMLYAIGRQWIEVPHVTQVRIAGKPGRGVFGRDTALYVNGRLGQRGAYGTAVEFAGSYIDELSMDMRFTYCNMGTELGGVASYIQPDRITLDYLKPRARKPYTVYETDRDFRYAAVHEVDISGIGPQIAIPHEPDNVKPVDEVAGKPIDQAYIGSCASGRLEDIAAAAAVVKGRKVHPDVRFIVAPGSREVALAASRLGYIDILLEANAIVSNTNCGACNGLSGGVLAPGEVAITSITRNFEGRMGPGADIYLASPATVAASALAGRIANPLGYLS
jgi:homoaconitate hydratase family protein